MVYFSVNINTIFKNVEGERVFYDLHKYYKNEKNKVVNYSFIFREMVQSDYLNAPYKEGRNHRMFIEWLSMSDSTSIDIDRIVTLNRIGDLSRKRDNYRSVVNSVQRGIALN